ncbi:MAG: c-type cytochrome biogenesis protein CcmI [Terricaulis sp.]
MLWLALAVLAACAGAFVALPFLRPRDPTELPTAAVDFYKTQLDDVAKAEALGDLDEPAAAELRTEIERRIIATPASAAPAAVNAKFDRAAATWVAAVVVLGSAVLYAATGQPDAPSAARAALGAQGAAAQNLPDVDTLIERLRARLESQPADAAGWRMLGWSYFETGRAAEAVEAYSNAVAIEPGNADYQSGYGEALTGANQGAVSSPARQAFTRALASDPSDERARFYLALAKAQGGNVRAAIEDWIAALRAAPADSPWAPRIRAEVENAARQAGIDIAGRLPAPPPDALGARAQAPALSPDVIAQAQQQSPEAQQQMINGMVDGLEQRLAANPSDADGWVRLMRARMVLGQPERARVALQRGLAAFANDRPTQQRLRAAAAELNVPAPN